MKIIDKNNQVEQLTKDILKSKELNHYIIYKNELLYLTGLEDARECIENNNYIPVGVITKTGHCNNGNYIKNQINKMLKTFEGGKNE